MTGKLLFFYTKQNEKKIYLLSQNSHKIKQVRSFLRPLGYEVVTPKKEIQSLEIQSGKIEDIVRFKLNQARQEIGGRIMVDDFSFYIKGQNGFPGPCVKYILKTLGLEFIVNFLGGASPK